MGVRIIWRCFFEIKYVHAKRAEERTLRVFLCHRAVRAAACSAKADGTERCVGRGVSRAQRRNPLYLTGGYKSDKIGELRKTLNKINQKRR